MFDGAVSTGISVDAFTDLERRVSILETRLPRPHHIDPSDYDQPAEPEAETETVPVEFEVTSIETVRGRGRLHALVSVSLSIGGVEMWCVLGLWRQRDGRFQLHAPDYRAADGGKRPALGLPAEIWDALGSEVKERLEQGAQEQMRNTHGVRVHG